MSSFETASGADVRCNEEIAAVRVRAIQIAAAHWIASRLLSTLFPGSTPVFVYPLKYDSEVSTGLATDIIFGSQSAKLRGGSP